MKKILGITIARGGSKAVKNKNIRDLAGKPLIAYTIEEALKSNLNNYIVSTDSKPIAKIACQYGADVIMRPEHLATDLTPALAALQHATAYMEKEHGEYYVIADIRCTNPFKFYTDINGALALMEDFGCDSVIGVQECYPPERIKRIDEHGRICDVVPEPEDGTRQNLEKAYIRNGTFYILKRDVLMGENSYDEQGQPYYRQAKLFGHDFSVAYHFEHGVNIDTEFDFWMAQKMMLGGYDAVGR